MKDIHCSASIDVYSSHLPNPAPPSTILPTHPSQPRFVTAIRASHITLVTCKSEQATCIFNVWFIYFI